MKRIALAVILLASIASATNAPRQAPDIQIVTPGGKSVKPSDYRGKVVILTFFLTTCPHCQKAIQILNGVQKDFGPKGVQVLAGAMNEDGNIPDFVKAYQTNFPVGTVDRIAAGAYMHLDPSVRVFVPFVVFIDRKGMIQAQYTGGDDFLKNEDQEDKNFRDQTAKLLGNSKPAPVAKHKK